MRRLLLVACLAGCAGAAPPRAWTSRTLPERDALFFPDGSRWRGGDAIYSVPLSADRVLWLFGDSYIAAPGHAERAGSRMIRNSLAIERKAGGPLEYFWQSSSSGQAEDAFRPASGPGWLWPLSGVRVGPRVHLFMMQMVSRGGGAFGFAVHRSLLLTIENPDDAPASWKTHESDLPQSVGRPGADLYLGGASAQAGGVLYAYGLHEHPGPGGRGIIVARVDPAAAQEAAAWRFLGGDGWTPDPLQAKDLFTGGSVEMSVSPFDGGFAAVYTRGGLSPEIVVRQAPRPEGPWGPPAVVHRCAEADWNPKYFCYAAKAHPELGSGDRELIVSYAVNSTDFGQAVHDLRIYRPRFVRVGLD